MSVRSTPDKPEPSLEAAWFSPMWLRAASILYYMLASIATQSATKATLTVYGFHHPLTLTLAQMLFAAPVCAAVSRAPLDWRVLAALLPLGLISGANILAGMMGTGGLSVPMFIVLRRFTMVITLLLERFVYHQRQSWPVLMAVALMIAGALLAAVTDLSFSFYGYAATLTNDLFTAAYLVMLKRLPAARELDTVALLYYNSLISLVPLALAAVATGDLARAMASEGMGGTGFRVAVGACVCLGLSTSHSTYLCTRANEPLTTTVAGSFKNIVMTVIGAFAFGDYSYEPLNAAGIVMSMVGAIWYALHAALAKSATKSKPTGRAGLTESREPGPHGA